MSPELTRFIDSYFEAWSLGDMDAYGALFHEEARIFMILNGIPIYHMARGEFLELQRRETSRRNMTERMVSCTVDEDERAASVTVSWELEEEDRVTTGVDRFILMRDTRGTWRILSLLFYIDE